MRGGGGGRAAAPTITVDRYAANRDRLSAHRHESITVSDYALAISREVVALYPYTGQGPDELSFAAGDSITISAKQDHGEGNEWVHGSLSDGTTGIFPANYISSTAADNPAAAALALQ